ncbi:MAG: DUF1805 domain-containing protein [Bacteroidetes bacterium]|nr:DUF1805 domain-containing protein [Bacteroidota bacterium]
MNIEGKEFKAHAIATTNTNILIITSEKGFLACGYIKAEVANKVGDVCAIVTGVKSTDDLLVANVITVSEAAEKLGVKVGMTGKEALLLMS